MSSSVKMTRSPRVQAVAKRLLVAAALLTAVSACGAGQRTEGDSRSDSRPDGRATGRHGAHLGRRHGAARNAAATPVDDSAVVPLGRGPALARSRPMHLRMIRPEICSAWSKNARKAEVEVGLAPKLLLAIAWVESDFQPRARSAAGAQGPMQLMPRTSRAFGCRSPERPSCAFPAAAALLRRLLDRFDGKVVYALCAYNAGAGRISGAWRKGALPFNTWYAERVLAAKARLERHGCRGRP